MDVQNLFVCIWKFLLNSHLLTWYFNFQVDTWPLYSESEKLQVKKYVSMCKHKLNMIYLLNRTKVKDRVNYLED